ncbi:MAG: hypothetical protein ACQESR_05270 [Planctomycetota bacterium]
MPNECISGGWIFSGGKLPDARRPPVGRTRGGEPFTGKKPISAGVRTPVA